MNEAINRATADLQDVALLLDILDEKAEGIPGTMGITAGIKIAVAAVYNIRDDLTSILEGKG